MDVLDIIYVVGRSAVVSLVLCMLHVVDVVALLLLACGVVVSVPDILWFSA